jgi:hypothetical protein
MGFYRYKDVFVDELDNTHAINVPLFEVGLIKPFHGVRPRPTAEAKLPFLKWWLEEYERKGIIRRSNSLTTSPIHMIDKGTGDGRFRVTVDASVLNSCFPLVQVQMPMIQEIIGRLGGHMYYTHLDMPDSFFQLPCADSMTALYAFSTAYGNWEYTEVLPQGDKNIPGHMTLVMGIVLRGLDAFCASYIDDIYIYSDSAEEHVEHVLSVLDRLEKHNFKITAGKTVAATRSILALGFFINQAGYRPADEQKAKFLAAPFPDKGQLKQWFGLLGVFRNLLPRVDRIEIAFSAARKKGAEYIVTDEMITAFELAQRMVSEMQMMQFVDPLRPLYLEVDASDTGTGALLFQERPNPHDPSTPLKDPIRWTSHMFTSAALKWPTIEKEGFAIIRAVQVMEMMLLGRPFVLRTDHRNLLYMGHSSNLRVPKWQQTARQRLRYVVSAWYVRTYSRFMARIFLLYFYRYCSLSILYYIYAFSISEVARKILYI